MDAADRSRHRGLILALGPLALATGACAARALLAHAPARFAIDRAQALAVATNWGGYGTAQWLLLAAALACAAIPSAVVLRGRGAPPLAMTLGYAAASMLAGFAWLPLFSSDVYAYAAYGEMARLGLDPYLHASASTHAAAIDAARWQWSGSLPICVYGSAFVALARAVMTLCAHAPLVAALDTLRALSCAAALVSAALLYAVRGGDTRSKRRTAFVFAANPVVLWSAIEGHNDTLMLAIVLAGAWLARRRLAAGIALVALGALVKLPALAAASAMSAQRILARRDALQAAGGWIVGTLAVVAGSLALLHGVRSDLAPHGHYAPQGSVQALSPILAGLLALAVLLRLRAFEHGFDRWTIAALALWLAIPNPYPWYGLWIVPLGALARDGRIRAAACTIAAVALLRYLPDAAGTPDPLASAGLAALALAAYAPLFSRAIISRS